jgi:SAM-dependent MidA family methyltransferase
MEMALYQPGYGYYVAGQRKFGAEGDFITAPEISPLFARALSRQIVQVLQPGDDLIEFGAGSGVLALELLRELQMLEKLPQRYLIIELSPDLKKRQQQLLKAELPHLFDRICWLDGLPSEKINGVVLANEVLDAMPVHRFRIHEHHVEEQIVLCEDQHPVLAWRPAEPALQENLRHLHVQNGLESEINLRLQPWIRSVFEMLERGIILLIDYGYPRSEYYHPQRSTGTLMCHHRHKATDNPCNHPGLQDITAHVDFTAVAEAADEAGFGVAGYTSQANFLLGCGIEQLLRRDAQQQDANWYREIEGMKRLTLPTEMGERFKVIALAKGVEMEGPLIGFALRDQRHLL